MQMANFRHRVEGEFFKRSSTFNDIFNGAETTRIWTAF